MARRWFGRSLIVIGALHASYGVITFHPALARIAAAWFWNALGDRDRQLAFWFVFGGAAMALIGTLVDAAERERRVLPRVFTLGLLVLAAVSVVLDPASGFWLVFAAAARSVTSKGTPTTPSTISSDVGIGPHAAWREHPHGAAARRPRLGTPPRRL